MKRPNHQRHHLCSRGFSLVELLTVIALVAVLMVLGSLAILPLVNSSRINQATSQLVDALNLARQTAVSRSATVEIRFYKLPASASDSGNVKFRAFALYLVEGDGIAPPIPLEAVQHLPKSVVILEDPEFSSLLDVGNSNRSGLTSGTEQLPAQTGSVAYVGFRFRASAMTSLSPVTPPDNHLWYLTLCQENAPIEGETGLPANYATIQVEPVTGKVKTYRP